MFMELIQEKTRYGTVYPAKKHSAVWDVELNSIRISIANAQSMSRDKNRN